MSKFSWLGAGGVIFVAAFLVAAQESAGTSAPGTETAQAVASDEDAAVSGQTGQEEAAGQKGEDEQLAELKGQVEGMNESFLETKASVGKLSKIKISGYTQFQYRTPVNYDEATDTAGTGKAWGTYKYPVGDFAGGKFGDRIDGLFQVRRGRIKVAYETELNTGVIQFDCVPVNQSNVAGTTLTTVLDTIKDSLGRNHVVTKTVTTASTSVVSGGGVTIKDAYLRFTEPWLKSIALKGGVFDRPFGFEIMYSSSNRESPERSRLFQTLFPGERDLGLSLEFLPSDNVPGIGQYFNLRAGAFTGNGISVEKDGELDYIGRLGVSIPLTGLNMGIDAGASMYSGAVLNLSDSLYAMSSGVFTGSKGHRNTAVGRSYTGGDVQIYYGNIPALGGATLRFEAITGTQPGSKTGTASSGNNLTSSGALYKRNFTGYYGMLVQNLDPIRSQLVFKYDEYDPNSDIEGAAIASAAEMKYSTIGLGLVYHWDENVKLVAYLDKVANETIGAAPFTADVKDDVFTFRIQYKF